MKKAAAIFLLILSIISSSIFSSNNCSAAPAWDLVYSFPGAASIMTFTSSSTGFARTAVDLQMTTNGGSTWSVAISDTTNSLTFVNSSTGFAWLNKGISKTTDGGLTWTLISPQRFSKFYLIDSLYAFGAKNVSPYPVLKTSDGGITWVQVSSTNPFISQFFYFDQNNWLESYYRSSTKPSNLYWINRTTNGGSNWLVSYPQNSDYSPYDFFKLDSSTAFAGTMINHIFKTTNKGANWVLLATNFSTHTEVYSVYFKNLNTGYAAGKTSAAGGFIDKTINGGTAWTNTLTITGDQIRKILFTDEMTGYASTSGGKIYKTTTGGVVTGFTEDPAGLPGKFSLSQNYPNPFNPTTQITYELPVSDLVSLKVFDVNGKEAASLVNETQPAGSYRVEFNGSSLPSGIYFYTLKAGEFTETRKMLLVK